jgi:hypothetical protein
MEIVNMMTVTTKLVDLMMETVICQTVIVILLYYTTINATIGVILKSVIMTMTNVLLRDVIYAILILLEITTVILSVMSKYVNSIKVIVLMMDVNVLKSKWNSVILIVIA